MEKWYVYVDYKPCGTPFYVGKGKIERIKKLNRVNKHHLNICKKYPDWYRTVEFEGLEQDCFNKEIELIALHGRIDTNSGTLCNRTNGGEGVSGSTAWNKGKPMLPHVLQKLIAVNTGKKASIETKMKMSAAQKKVVKVGVPHTEEAKAKMSKTRKGVNHTPEWKQRISDLIKANWALRKSAKQQESLYA
jgi:hypothetical protein